MHPSWSQGAFGVLQQATETSDTTYNSSPSQSTSLLHSREHIQPCATINAPSTAYFTDGNIEPCHKSQASSPSMIANRVATSLFPALSCTWSILHSLLLCFPVLDLPFAYEVKHIFSVFLLQLRVSTDPGSLPCRWEWIIWC